MQYRKQSLNTAVYAAWEQWLPTFPYYLNIGPFIIAFSVLQTRFHLSHNTIEYKNVYSLPVCSVKEVEIVNIVG